MQNYNCIIIDDNELDRLIVESFVRKFNQFSILGNFSNVVDATKLINTSPIDILFLDIDMPEMSGLEFRRIMKDIPVCVFITSHAEYAVEGFEVEALDFIVKPVDLERFTRTVQRIGDYLELKKNVSSIEKEPESIFLKEGYVKTRIFPEDILYIEALKDLSLVVTEKKRHCVSTSFGQLLNIAELQSFVRVHRSYAINKNHIQKISSNKVELTGNLSVPIGRNYKKSLESL